MLRGIVQLSRRFTSRQEKRSSRDRFLTDVAPAKNSWCFAGYVARRRFTATKCVVYNAVARNTRWRSDVDRVFADLMKMKAIACFDSRVGMLCLATVRVSAPSSLHAEHVIESSKEIPVAA